MTKPLTQETLQQRLAQLEAENASLRAAQRGFQGALHPAVEPKFTNGSLVVYEGATHRVTGRSIDWDGVVAYTLAPVTGGIVSHTVKGTSQITAHDLNAPEARLPVGSHVSRVFMADIHPDDQLFEIPEDALEAFHPDDLSEQAQRTAPAVPPAGVNADTIIGSEGVSITSEG